MSVFRERLLWDERAQREKKKKEPTEDRKTADRSRRSESVGCDGKKACVGGGAEGAPTGDSNQKPEERKRLIKDGGVHVQPSVPDSGVVQAS